MAPNRKLKKNRKRYVIFMASAIATTVADAAAKSHAQSSSSTLGRMTTLAIGIPGVNISQVQREIPPDEPPPLPPNAELSVIGKRTQRLDARLKVTGAARYTSDVQLPGMLYGKMLRSPYPHARIRSIDTSAAERYPGVRAVHILDRVVGGATERDPKPVTPGQLPLIRFVGQPIAAVAATTPDAAEEAVRSIRVEYEQLPFVADMEAARQSNAPLVFQGPTEQAGTGGGGGAPKGLPQRGNVRGPVKENLFGGSRGDVKQGFAEAEVTVVGEFRTQVQTHSALETHGIVADWKPESLTVYISTQDTAGVRNELADVFELPKSQVRVITEFMGGGFGAKFGIGNYGAAATYLSKKAGAPVRLMLDRKEEHLAVGNRPGTMQKLRIGAKRDGTLTAISLSAYGTAGVGLGAGVGNIAQVMYKCPNFDSEQYDVLINAGPGAAFRAPGNPQGAFALEQLIDELSERLQIDPLALRDKIDESPTRREQRRIGADRIGWSQRHAPGADSGSIKRGIGMAQSFWPRIVEMDSSCEVRVLRDGSVEVRSSVQDIGTGIRTVLAQVVAEEFGLQAADITVRIGDTMFPVGPGSGGSKTTGSITPAARNAAYRVRQQMLQQVAPALGVNADALTMKDGRIFVSAAPSKGLSFREAAKKLPTEQIAVTANRSEDYGGFQIKTPSGDGFSHGGLGGVQFVEVSVDTEIGLVRVERVVAVHDCGRPINPLQLESQINGGILQGTSWALYENRHLCQKSGAMVNANFDQYKILGSRETPKIEILLLEDYQGRSSTDAGGIGEPAIIPTAAAIANAIYNATGVRLRDLPMTPERVLAALNASRRTS
ncbi:xanthine dehydrogenase family protein molybdopterin-binding subunit [Scytonema sp. NUACC26]|uniref:xanthine dehydrogenase family protein molybdopterin-binding subunit n=1 Tax=Scytonema sp. NUACC26 TaxID=3140176 RepID=UPI0034DC2375